MSSHAIHAVKQVLYSLQDEAMLVTDSQRLTFKRDDMLVKQALPPPSWEERTQMKRTARQLSGQRSSCRRPSY
jgi:hypothetical protein